MCDQCGQDDDDLVAQVLVRVDTEHPGHVSIESRCRTSARHILGLALRRISYQMVPPNESAWVDAIGELRRLYPDDDRALALAVVGILAEGPL